MQTNNQTKYLKVKIHNFFIALVLIGAINWGMTVFNMNLVESLHLLLNKILGFETFIDKVIYLLIAISAIIVGIKKSTWLPFLGEAVFPAELIPNKEKEESDLVVTVKVSPYTKVAYWASLPQKDINKIPDVVTAYGDYSNSGVVVSDANGNVNLAIESSSSYKIPSGEVLKRHIHYRELGHELGFIGEIKTVFY